MPGTIEPIENGAYRIRHLKVDVEVGDSKVAGFKPHLKLRRWDGECFVALGFAAPAGNVKVEGGRVKWESPLFDFHYYAAEPRVVSITVDGVVHKFIQNEEGGLEFEVILKKKPPANSWAFPIQTEGLRFAYQPPLHPDHPTWADRNGDGKPDAFRPENVVGSYAVYHATRTKMHGNPADAEKYKCGKAFHIYRPHLVDALGAEAWAKIDISDGVFTITLPQQFLDEAVYPVKIDPDFGYTSAGSSDIAIALDTFTDISKRMGSAWNMPAGGGTANYIKAYLYGDTDAVDCKVFINQKDSGGAGTHGQIATKENLACAAAAHWEQFNLAGEVLASGIVYILSICGNPDDLSYNWNYYVKCDINGCVASYNEIQNYGAPESPWVVDPESPWTADYSIYCNYTGGGPAPPAAGGLKMIPSLKGHMGYDLKTRGGKARRRIF